MISTQQAAVAVSEASRQSSVGEQVAVPRLPKPLRALIVEDSEDDCELLLLELKRGGYAVEHRRVDHPQAIRAALAEGDWDLVISDYSMPHCSAMGALEVVGENHRDLPVIIVSGAVGEDTAVETLKAGAHDFIVKGRLTRLLPAIERELREAKVRSERRQAMAEREIAEQRLREAVQARDDFLSIASHELKTPITVLKLQISKMLGNPQRERTKNPDREELQTRLKLVMRHIDHLTDIVNSLLDVTRITSRRLTLVRQEVDLQELVRDWLDRYQETVKRSGSEVVVRVEQRVAGVWDPVAVETVVGNLLSNAVKFGQGKPIDVAVDRQQNMARLMVRDYGIGIAPKEQARIFERFERAVSSRHYGGFGIGLWAAVQMVEAHGGTIRVSSIPDEGSTFTVELPIN